MGREIRRVPKNWEHPKNKKGKFIPLLDDYIGYLGFYKEEVDKFIFYMTEIIEKNEVKVYGKLFTNVKELYEYLNEDNQIKPPIINDFMLTGEWYQLFENVSEGTPLSPPFETKKELIEWLVNNQDYWNYQWTKAQAEGILKSEYSPSFIVANGKLYTSAEAAEL